MDYHPIIQNPTSEDIQQLVTVNWLNSKNFTKKGRLEDHAAIIGITPSTLKDYCTDSFGKPFRIFLTDLRLEYALRLMLKMDISATNAAILSGFDDYSNFKKTYKERYGLKPTDHISLIKESLGVYTDNSSLLERIKHRLKYPQYHSMPNGIDPLEYYLKRNGHNPILCKERFPLLDIE